MRVREKSRGRGKNLVHSQGTGKTLPRRRQGRSWSSRSWTEHWCRNPRRKGDLKQEERQDRNLESVIC